jgi:hypothetical protein
LSELSDAEETAKPPPVRPPDIPDAPLSHVLLQEFGNRISNLMTPLEHQLARIAPQVLFQTPSRISRAFPTIKLKITSINDHAYDIEALLDSGATATYIGRSFIEDHNVPTRLLSTPIWVYNADDSVHNRAITHEAMFTVTIQGHTSSEWFYVAELGTKSMVIGMTWLRSHNPVIDWRSGKIDFTRCPSKCGGNHLADDNFQTLLDDASMVTQQSIQSISYDPKKHLSTQLAIEDFKNKKVLTLDDIRKGPFADYIDVFEEKGYQELPPHREWDHKIDLVPEWREHLWKPYTYPLTYDEGKELDKFLEENLANGRIRRSESELASPVFFINKKDGQKRMVIDYRKLNEITVKNKYPLPLLEDLISGWKGCVYFSVMDVRSGYYNIRMREGDEWKTAFTTSKGMFESLVMTFGLTNAPATFQTMMDSIFVVYVRRGGTKVFIDDVIMATRPDPTGKLSNEDFHIKCAIQLLEIFRAHHLFLKLQKCDFMQLEVPYFGHILNGKEVKPDPVKLDGIRKWPPPSNLKQLRSFLGFMNYYRRFIHNYAHIARPLNDLLRKDVPWTWEKPQQEAFDTLKAAMVSAPVLVYSDHERPYLLETDASDVAYGAVLSQKQDDDKWHPVAFLSKSMSPAERNYAVHDRELLAIIRALEEWRHLLMGAKFKIDVLTDHANLLHFRKKIQLNPRQRRWALYMENFDLNLLYRPGRQSSIPDALSRRTDHGEAASRQETALEQLLPDSIFSDKPPEPSHNIQQVHTSPSPPTFDLRHELYLAQAQDPLILKLNMTKEGETLPDHWGKQDDLWTYWGKIYIPPILQQTVFRILHSDPSAGHPGRDATLFSIRKDYYWPNMKSDVSDWIRACDMCQHTKVLPKKPHGELKPIDPTPRPWGVVTSDLITGLPPCHGYTAIWTVTDKRTKMIHIHETKDTLDSEGLYHLYLRRVWSAHGTSDKLITDRGPQYSSRFARDANKNLQIETALSTAYHPQTDGQSERTNQSVEQVLRTVVSFHQDDWVDWLPMVEFALNNQYKKSLKTTPFYANYGFHPQIGSLPKIDTPIISVEDFIRHIQQVQKDTKKSLEQAAVDMKRFYDRHRGKTPEYEVGQKVLLDNADLAINRPSRKLAERRSGPFKVLERIGTHAYKLELPLQWKNVHLSSP